MIQDVLSTELKKIGRLKSFKVEEFTLSLNFSSEISSVKNIDRIELF